ncbi:hypothetical protein BOTBODRAFT_113519 [Botryobasidium botryosum FD-172 SS1]|uniref:ABC transporter domain-containing protein n=1 Tax=Botryobasidium botryosum (strain FD-172 SS1) TaxID=930990 RepID=A0A067MBC5_BOTB1|nr:hypothetical protein BOTBODRAFT_113519 [Botryobasidium botryosum FD-172 SS1]
MLYLWIAPRRATSVNTRSTRLSRLLSYGKSPKSNTDVYSVISIPRADIYRFGEAHPSPPLFKDVEWEVKDGQTWAVVGPEKTALLETLLGHHRVAPNPPAGLFPFLTARTPPFDPHDTVSIVSFSTRNRRPGAPAGGAFYDYSARYGAVREEDRITLRESLPSQTRLGEEVTDADVRGVAGKLELEGFLELPLVALSNGQTRRASVMRELLERPRLLILDEPLTGLDVIQRPILLDLLYNLHIHHTPRILLGLRPQDALPKWITHLAIAKDGTVKTGLRDSLDYVVASHTSKDGTLLKNKTQNEAKRGKEVVSLKGVRVAYHDRQVLNDINWTIREGDRWHLHGPNGSGKTTLLSLITGDHPQSYVQKHLQLFGQPRKRLATAQLQQRIGHVSPELYNAFPRRQPGLSVREAIATGFESTFSYRPRTQAMDDRIDELLAELGPAAWGKTKDAKKWDEQPFANLTPGEQSVALLLRALTNRPSLLILDEVFAGMDDRMVEVAKAYLRDRLDETQAVVFVTHWEEEVPWAGARRIRLGDGSAELMYID